MNDGIKEKVSELQKNSVQYNEEEHMTISEQMVLLQLNEIRNLMQSDKWEESRSLLESNLPLIEDFEKRFSDTNKEEFRVFNEAFDEIIYSSKYKTEGRDICYMPMLSVDYFITYAIVLKHFKEYGKAIEYYKRVLFRNPMEPHATFQLIEVYKLTKKIDELYDLAKEAFTYLYRPKDVARVHRCMGYYFVEKKEFDIALAYYGVSLMYDPEYKAVLPEIQAIMDQHNIIPMDFNTARKLMSEKGYPYGPNFGLIGLANTLAKSSLDMQRTNQAKYFYEIVYDLSHSSEAKQQLEKLN